MKKVSILVLTFVLCMTMCFVPSVTAFAAGSTVTVAAGTLNYSDEAQTVTVTIAVDPGADITAYGGNVVVPDGWSVSGSVKVKGTDKDGDAFTSKQDPAVDNNYSFNQIATMTATSVEITYNVPAAASGTFTLGATNLQLAKSGVNQIEGSNDGITATTNVTITAPEPTPAEGYTVAMSSDAPAAGVAKGSSFDVSLDVTNANATTFNAFYSVLTYDSTKVSYAGEGKAGDYTVDTSESGKLIVSRVGSDVTIGDTPELTLPFKADVAGNADFTLIKANVDVKQHAEAEDAPDATFSSTPLTVTVLETYTVAFAKGGDSVTGTDPTQAATVEGGTFELPANPYTYANHTFAGWNDGTKTYEAGATYTMPARNVTLTAQWTENPVLPVVENVNGTTDDKQPDYVGTNEAASNELVVAKITGPEGYVPTYDGNPMFKVEGYDDNYYYVIPDRTYDNEKLGFVEGTVKTIAKSSDVNQTKRIDINDAQLIYNIYQDGYTPETVEKLILADTDRDKKVDVSDCAVVVGDIQ